MSQGKNLLTKRVDFGSKEEKKFTIFRNMESPFVDTTLKDNPSPWNYHKKRENPFKNNDNKLKPIKASLSQV